MTVRELMEQLQAADPAAAVVLDAHSVPPEHVPWWPEAELQLRVEPMVYGGPVVLSVARE